MKRIVSSLLLIISLQAVAQSDTTSTRVDSVEKTPVQFKISVNYNTALHYYGRTDSLKSTGLFPMAEIWFTPKFYVNAAPIFVNNAFQSFDYAGTVTTLGYLHIDKKWMNGIYVLKPFYNQDAKLVQSALKAQAGVNISKLNKVLNVNLGGDVKFSDRTDFGATAGVDKLIRIQNKKQVVFIIDPTVTVNAGTQEFTKTYNRKQQGTLLLPGSSQEVNENVREFNILSYEASVPLIYAKDKFMFIAIPSYVIPQNLLTVENRPDLSEKGQNMFTTTFAIKYTF